MFPVRTFTIGENMKRLKASMPTTIVGKVCALVATVLVMGLLAYSVPPIISYAHERMSIQDGRFTLPTSQAESTPLRSAPQTPSTSATAPTSSLSRTAVALSPEVVKWGTCKPGGTPVGVVIPSLGVSAKVVDLGDAVINGQKGMAAPDDAHKGFIGFYKFGPKPGSPGRMLLDGHTYIDGTSVFNDQFASKMKVGAQMRVTSSNGSTCVYRADKIWPHLAKERSDSSAAVPYFTDIVEKQIYDLFGPSSAAVMTCSGKIGSNGHHIAVSVVRFKMLNPFS